MTTPQKNTKQAAIIRLLRRPKGASVEEISQKTGWLPHTVRGFFANALKKRLQLTMTSSKERGKPRRYRVAS